MDTVATPETRDFPSRFEWQSRLEKRRYEKRRAEEDEERTKRACFRWCASWLADVSARDLVPRGRTKRARSARSRWLPPRFSRDRTIATHGSPTISQNPSPRGARNRATRGLITKVKEFQRIARFDYPFDFHSGSRGKGNRGLDDEETPDSVWQLDKDRGKKKK